MNLNSQAITIAKTLLDIKDSSQDGLLVVLGTIAEQDALTFTNNESILFEYGILGRMIQYAFNSRGNEGLTNQSFATVSESYTSGVAAYPHNITSALKRYNKIKTL